MKKLSLSQILLMFLLFWCIPIFPQFGWIWQNPTLNGYGANASWFIDQHTGWIVSFVGTVMKTTDGGATWQYQYIDGRETLLGVEFVSPTHGYVFGAGGVFFETMDAGVNWIRKPNNIGQYLTNSCFLTEQTGWVCGYNGTIAKTTDAGTTWQPSPSGTTSMLQFISFLNADTGFAGGFNNILLRTTNGGASWDSVSQAGNSVFYSGCIASSQVYYAGSWSTVLRSTDGGLNWTSLTLPNVTEIRSIFTNGSPANLLVAGTTGTSAVVHYSTNYGDTWTTLLDATGRKIKDMSFTGNSIICAGNQGYWGMTLLASTNFGTNWNDYSSHLFTNDNIASIWFRNPLTGYATTAPADSIFKTTDGGTTWVGKPYFMNAWFADIAFFDELTGIAVGSKYSIVRTTDGGESWSNIQLDYSSYTFGQIAVTSPTSALLFGSRRISKTTDAGLTWSTLIADNSRNFNSGYFLNPDTGYTAGSTTAGVGFIHRTTDGGNTWSEVYSGGGVFSSICFTSYDTGWAGGAGGVVGWTTDAGVTWNPVHLGTTEMVVEMEFINSRQGFVVAQRGGFISYTNDGGRTWHQQNAGLQDDISALCYHDSANVWVGGYNGFIKKTPHGGIVTSAQEPIYTATIADKFELLQNYPNPFNPATIIRYTVPEIDGKTTLVQLKVYDVLGAEITTLVEKQAIPGTYSLQWNGSHLPSGIYFCRMTAGNHHSVIKMMLMR